MSAYISTACEDGEWRWSVVRTAPGSADVVVRGLRSYPDEESCREDAEQLSRLLPHAVVRQCPNGSWKWSCHDDDGTLIAESSPFPDAAECGHDLASARLETRGALPPAKVYIARARSADLVLED